MKRNEIKYKFEQNVNYNMGKNDHIRLHLDKINKGSDTNSE